MVPCIKSWYNRVTISLLSVNLLLFFNSPPSSPLCLCSFTYSLFYPDVWPLCSLSLQLPPTLLYLRPQPHSLKEYMLLGGNRRERSGREGKYIDSCHPGLNCYRSKTKNISRHVSCFSLQPATSEASLGAVGFKGIRHPTRFKVLATLVEVLQHYTINWGLGLCISPSLATSIVTAAI